MKIIKKSFYLKIFLIIKFFRYAKCIIAAVWGIALITALPIPIVSRLQQPGEWHKDCGRYVITYIKKYFSIFIKEYSPDSANNDL